MHSLARSYELFRGWEIEVGIAQESSWWVQGQNSANDRLSPSLERANHEKQAGIKGATVFVEQHLYNWRVLLTWIEHLSKSTEYPNMEAAPEPLGRLVAGIEPQDMEKLLRTRHKRKACRNLFAHQSLRKPCLEELGGLWRCQHPNNCRKKM